MRGLAFYSHAVGTAAFPAAVVIVTAGIGKFTPRELPAGEGWEDRGLVFFVPSFAEYAGRDVMPRIRDL